MGYDHCGCFTILDNILTVGESRRVKREQASSPEASENEWEGG